MLGARTHVPPMLLGSKVPSVSRYSPTRWAMSHTVLLLPESSTIRHPPQDASDAPKRYAMLFPCTHTCFGYPPLFSLHCTKVTRVA